VAPKFDFTATPATELTARILGADDRAFAHPAMGPVKRLLTLATAEPIAGILPRLDEYLAAMATDLFGGGGWVMRTGLTRGMI
jgi:hypothetical protein